MLDPSCCGPLCENFDRINLISPRMACDVEAPPPFIAMVLKVADGAPSCCCGLLPPSSANISLAMSDATSEKSGAPAPPMPAAF